ncbi:MAG: DUF3050 domain-containing protein [Planctomycetia bacterium]|nr:DUF3050 domain-containing protein [Planctomycetia bacterium]
MSFDRLAELQNNLAPYRQRLLEHSIYATVNSVPRLRAFMESHVFAVWDFMSLLKALQRSLTCVELPWLPTPHPAARHLINAIVLGEESDEDGRGGHLSHFELYLEAMDSCGANTQPVLKFCDQLLQGKSFDDAADLTTVNADARSFMSATFEFVNRGRPSEIAAAFTFGREDVIPDMFRQFVETLCSESPENFERFRFYLIRHIDLDADDHGPKALQMVTSICGDDVAEWAAAEKAAITAIEARLRFWDAVQGQLASI